MNYKEIDEKFGFEKEEQILDIINIKFNDNIKKCNRYNKYDFEGLKYKYELKSRRNNYNSYPTTMIPEDKIKENMKIIFLFSFIDGLYYIKYRPKIFNTFETRNFRRTDRGSFDIEKKYIYIPIEKLKLIKA
jgi:hypothetical protein